MSNSVRTLRGNNAGTFEPPGPRRCLSGGGDISAGGAFIYCDWFSAVESEVAGRAHRPEVDPGKVRNRSCVHECGATARSVAPRRWAALVLEAQGATQSSENPL